MRLRYFCLMGAFLMVCLPVISSAAETTVTFPKPGDPGTLQITGPGEITVTAYNGRDVVIDSDSGQLEEVPATEEKAKGLKRITMNAFGISKIDDGNTIYINRSTRQKMDLTIRVPAKTSIVIGGRTVSRILEGDVFEGNLNDFLDEQRGAAEDRRALSSGTIVVPDSQQIRILGDQAKKLAQQAQNLQSTPVPRVTLAGGGITEGDITISNITGNIDVTTIEGNITLTGVSGVVTSSTVDGNVQAVMSRITGESPLYFSSVNGDVDVTLPSDTKATLTMQTVNGDVYTDFDLTISSATAGSSGTRSTGSASATAGSPRVRSTGTSTIFGTTSSNTVNADINGGGQEIRLHTVGGDIYLRKVK